jgi:glycosyltransferase involved in cell wall biosynthesis
MNILMMTNTYLPHVGGVAQSVHRFAEAYQRKGHETLVVAPEFPGAEESEDMVVRVPAVQNFNGSDFSVMVPVPFYLTSSLNKFSPDVIHSHHPFLLGSTALRVAAIRDAPLVFTHHTMYEHYTHYVPLEAKNLKKFVIQLCTAYANHCDQVIAPSKSVRDVLKKRGVKTPVTVIPTGVDFEAFSEGDGARARKEHGLDAECYVVGHVGRLAPEKNLEFLAGAVAPFLSKQKNAHFLVAGEGPSKEAMAKIFDEAGVSARVHFAGRLADQALIDFYHAMDVFVFASKTETQGMVLVEAMAAGTPVLALEASGVTDVLDHRQNGWMVREETTEAFVEGLNWLVNQDDAKRRFLSRNARETGEVFSTEHCAQKALKVYDKALRRHRRSVESDAHEWTSLLKALEEEWVLWRDRIAAAAAMLQSEQDEQS